MGLLSEDCLQRPQGFLQEQQYHEPENKKCEKDEKKKDERLTENLNDVAEMGKDQVVVSPGIVVASVVGNGAQGGVQVSETAAAAALVTAAVVDAVGGFVS